MNKPSMFTASDELAMVVGDELATAFLEHRKLLKKPMTAYAAQLMAKRLRTMPDPVGSVEQSLRLGWLDVFAVREERQQSHGSTRGLGHFARAIQDEESSNASNRQISAHADDRYDDRGVPRLGFIRH
jgi:hypothetical protein